MCLIKRHLPTKRQNNGRRTIKSSKYADDERNFVKKAVNWALRQIGKRNKNLYQHALAVAERLKKRKERSARWIGNDAFRELSKRGTS